MSDTNSTRVFSVRTGHDAGKGIDVRIGGRGLSLGIRVGDESQFGLASSQSRTKGRAGHESRLGHPAELLTKTFIIYEEEGTVFDDRPSEAAAKLIQLEDRT